VIAGGREVPRSDEAKCKRLDGLENGPPLIVTYKRRRYGYAPFSQAFEKFVIEARRKKVWSDPSPTVVVSKWEALGGSQKRALR
jgi:hypothetical protein